mmetsp:Transcript_8370/g.18645  ORF Transcript_8370/g.18645 Transcript_8370/m.18645 type:complete len:615 (+) Transcript_8370:291-2135(+)|eukprot:CAMPEP_0206432708 /NCGR_PEP_ID=MMETSP0324_2-20121206/8115_1 /ASSEMBLY_ACC=CAM_ASM_000836 /TAXON_ID=2866 /ORGANISM="Crypthecodinium cohnii, Strain Seligo" /LENGTH=614 /DNA_ID=CAMNT_0053898867 /DNA_START=112 /DNA_END=1956 /DNA_ORIENTATION=+
MGRTVTLSPTNRARSSPPQLSLAPTLQSQSSSTCCGNFRFFRSTLQEPFLSPAVERAGSEPPGGVSWPEGPYTRHRSDSVSSGHGYLDELQRGPGKVLNRGLGALNTSLNAKSATWNFSTCGSILLFLGAIATIVAIMGVEVIVTDMSWDDVIVNDPRKVANGLVCFVAIPLACTLVNFVLIHIRRTTFWWNPKATACCGLDPLAPGPIFLTILGLVRTSFQELLNENLSSKISFYINIISALIVLFVYYALLDNINAVIKNMAREQEIINKTPQVKKMQNLVRNITRTGRPEKDVVYCFSSTNTVPAEVLYYVWWLYYVGGKLLGAGIIFAMLMGVDRQFIDHALWGGMAFSTMTVGGFIFEMGPNHLSLLRLSLNKPFYVGDLVTLNTNGSMDSPNTSIMGFVENITMMYVVIRNFEMKQTWIPHKTFSSMIIQNWTRRPSKTVLLNIGISSRCPVARVKKLTEFGMRWIENSHEIQQKNYRKCHITKVSNGYNIEVIFFPCIGVTHRGIRQKFLVAFMAAAERLQIPFVPLQIQQNFCDERSTAPKPAGFIGPPSSYGSDKVDVQLDDLLPDPEDTLPKGVGLGFKEFPNEDNIEGPREPGAGDSHTCTMM